MYLLHRKLKGGQPLNRRDFIHLGGKLLAGTACIGAAQYLKASPAPQNDLVVLFTNDWHSRIDPFPMDGSRNQGLGGAAKRAALIKQIRNRYPNVLLLDAGDVFQGTPYFNFFGGELEFKLMTAMGYDAATMGNHDFDAGLEGFATQLPHAGFPFLCANYDFSGTILKDKTIPFKIFKKGPYKIGVFGVGIQLDGLVPARLYGATRYNDPVEVANHWARYLRHKKHCNLVICLSHLGYQYPGHKVSDQILAGQSKNIDLIIGGHTHTFLDTPRWVNNVQGEPVQICQTGWGGINLGMVRYGLNIGQQALNRDFSMLKIC